MVSTIWLWLTTNTMIGTLIITTEPADEAPAETVDMVAIAELKVFSCSDHT
mgnify:CR=1 FL=1